MKLRGSLINMLGEFVGLNKTPDFKLNAQSSLVIAEAVKEESRRYSMSMNFHPSDTDLMRQRAFSTNSACEGRETGSVSMDPSCRRLSEPSALPPFTPPKKRKLQKSSSNDSQKGKSKKLRSIFSSFGGGDENDEAIYAEYNNGRVRQRYTRRGSETFCGSVAAYSNNLSTINTRL